MVTGSLYVKDATVTFGDVELADDIRLEDAPEVVLDTCAVERMTEPGSIEAIVDKGTLLTTDPEETAGDIELSVPNVVVWSSTVL